MFAQEARACQQRAAKCDSVIRAQRFIEVRKVKYMVANNLRRVRYESYIEIIVVHLSIIEL